MAKTPRVAVATGAGRGMGKFCAARLAADFDVVVAVDVDEAPARETAEGIGGEPFAADISDPAAVRALAELVSSLGEFGGLAHAAGISSTMGDWRRIVEVDLRGSALLLDAFGRLVAPGSAAVCFASSAAHIVAARHDPELFAVLDDPLEESFLDRLAGLDRGPSAGSMDAYAWAKRGVMRLAVRESLRWGRQGGRVLSISPGIIDTPQARQEAEEHPRMKFMLDNTPLGRWGRPAEVAEFVAYLLSERASYLSGTDFLIDGGMMGGIGAAGGLPGL